MWEAATGTVTRGGLHDGEEGEDEGELDGIIEVKGVIWVGDTGDGGASSFLREISGREVRRWLGDAEGSEEVGWEWQVPGSQTSPSNHDDNDNDIAPKNYTAPLHAQCHCTSISLYISRPSPSSYLAASPFPDLLTPYYLNAAANPANHPWWLPSPTTYLAGTCSCTSCRRASGFPVTFWAFVPEGSIFLDERLSMRFPFPESGVDGGGDGGDHVGPSKQHQKEKEKEKEALASWPEGMKSYVSSPGVTRMFCGRCGAGIFWHGAEKETGRKGLVDVKVGVLGDVGGGVRREDWLRWWGERVSFSEDAVEKGLVGGLERGIREWSCEGGDGVARYAEGMFRRGDEKGNTRAVHGV